MVRDTLIRTIYDGINGYYFICHPIPIKHTKEDNVIKSCESLHKNYSFP